MSVSDIYLGTDTEAAEVVEQEYAPPPEVSEPPPAKKSLLQSKAVKYGGIGVIVLGAMSFGFFKSGGSSHQEEPALSLPPVPTVSAIVPASAPTPAPTPTAVTAQAPSATPPVTGLPGAGSGDDLTKSAQAAVVNPTAPNAINAIPTALTAAKAVPAPDSSDMGQRIDTVNENIKALDLKVEALTAEVRRLVAAQDADAMPAKPPAAAKKHFDRRRKAPEQRHEPMPQKEAMAPAAPKKAESVAAAPTPAPAMPAAEASRLKGFSIRAITRDGTAWVVKGGNVMVVRAGDQLPGVGTVTGVDPNTFTVKTTDGVIRDQE